MRVPYERHLIWLCLTGKARDKISDIYDRLTIPRPTKETLDDIEMRVLEKFPISNGTRKRLERKQYDEKDVSFFEALKFGYLYKVTFGDGQDELKVIHTELQEKILEHPTLRIAIECCIIKKMDSEEIAALSQAGYGVYVSKEAIEQFKNIFFNVDTFNKEDWRAYLNHVAAAQENYIYSRYFAALTKPKDEVMHLIGMPTKKTFSQFLETVLVTSDYKFKFYSRQNTMEGDRAARYWADVGVKAGERYEKFAAKDVTDFSNTIQTSFEYVNEDIPMATQDLLAEVKAPELEDKTKTGDHPAPPIPIQKETEV